MIAVLAAMCEDSCTVGDGLVALALAPVACVAIWVLFR